MPFNQIGGHIEKAVELSALAGERATLHEVMTRKAQDTGHYIALGGAPKAEEAAKAEDSLKVAESLKGAGKWALDAATKISTSLTTETTKQSTGMKYRERRGITRPYRFPGVTLSSLLGIPGAEVTLPG